MRILYWPSCWDQCCCWSTPCWPCGEKKSSTTTVQYRPWKPRKRPHPGSWGWWGPLRSSSYPRRQASAWAGGVVHRRGRPHQGRRRCCCHRRHYRPCLRRRCDRCRCTWGAPAGTLSAWPWPGRTCCRWRRSSPPWLPWGAEALPVGLLRLPRSPVAALPSCRSRTCPPPQSSSFRTVIRRNLSSQASTGVVGRSPFKLCPASLSSNCQIFTQYHAHSLTDCLLPIEE